ncbi:ankyrin repeat-containing domain protein [Thelonectria olida]|uniref:Ankyrin repeat-containing domain protein n=1 Tax=Thelonectria olida TaxID=1576542 RepID=A0A9P8VMP6_9HYPO|nr:ankyrin repeat-containing domain protein [Thelonectria olida]
MKGHLEVIQQLEADIEVADARGRTSLHLAVMHNKDDVVQKLIELSADMDKTDMYGETALLLALRLDKPEIAEKLLQAGADPNAHGESSSTALDFVVARENVDLGCCNVIRELLECEDASKAINCAAADGGTPLHRAVADVDQETVDMLLEAGANPNLTDDNGGTPLHGVFQKASSFISRRSRLSASGLDLAMRNMAKALVEKGADPRARNKLGQTPTDLAEEQGLTALGEYLLSV